MKAYQPVVGNIARALRPRTILDLPSGHGWLRAQIAMPDVAIDGIDLYEGRPAGYRNFLQRDLEDGVPAELGSYDMIVSCEGIEHMANPGLLLKSARRHLRPRGDDGRDDAQYVASRSTVEIFLERIFPELSLARRKDRGGAAYAHYAVVLATALSAHEASGLFRHSASPLRRGRTDTFL